MRKVLFIMSHLGSSSSTLINSLLQDPKIDIFNTNQIYDHYDKIEILTNNIHKRNNSAAIYMEEILHNYRFTCKMLCSLCKFIFIIREPSETLFNIRKNNPEYSELTAQRYYCFRLRGIYEYICRTPNSIVLNYEDIKKNNLSNLENYLGIDNIVIPEQSFSGSIYSEECENCYERYLNHITKLRS